MIFKTFDTDIDKISAKWGIFGRSFNDIGNAIVSKVASFNEEFEQTGKIFSSWNNSDSIWKRLYPDKDEIDGLLKNSLDEIISSDNIDTYIAKLDTDKAKDKIKSIFDHSKLVDANIKNWESYFDTLDNGEKYIIDLIKNTNDLSKLTSDDLVNANQKARDAAISHNKALQQQTLGAKAATLGMKALAMAGNVLLSVGVNLLINGFVKLVQASDNIAEKARELGDAFNDTKSDITDFRKRVDELYETINDNSSSIDEVKNARLELLTVQDEMLERFGDEKEYLDIITDAINNQANAWDNLTQKQWKASLDDLLDESFGESIVNFFGGYGTNVDRMLDKYGNYSTSIDLKQVGIYDENEFDKFLSELEKKGIEVVRDESATSDMYFAKLKGNASEVYDIISDIQSLSEEYDFSDRFTKNLAKHANTAKKAADDWKDTYNQYILYEEVLPNYRDQYKELTDAYAEYQDAWASGDEIVQNQALERYSKALQDIQKNIDDEYLLDFFENMYPELQAKVDTWEFKAKIMAQFDTHKLRGLKQSDILEMLDTDEVEPLEQVFNSLLSQADEYGVVTGTNSEKIRQFLDYLLEWEVLQSEITEKVKETASFSDIFAMEDAEGNLNNLGQLSQDIDNIQSAWSGLNEMMNNYNETGTITIDQFQNLLSYGDEYLQYLKDEKGNLSLNEEALKKVAAAKIENMKADILRKMFSNLNEITDQASAEEFLKNKINNTTLALAENTKELKDNIAARLQLLATQGNIDQSTLGAINDYVNNTISVLDTISSHMVWDGPKTSSVAWSEILEKEITALEKAAEAGTITYKEYLKERERLVEDYYKRGKISAEEYYTELEELAQAQVDYYDKVIAAVERRFDREIDKIQDVIDEIEEQNEKLEEQLDMYDSAINAVIRRYDAEIDRINEVNEGIEKQNDDLQEQLDKYDGAIDAIVDLLETQKEGIQDNIDSINDENEAIQEQIDDYDLLLNAVTLVFDEKRDAIQSEMDILDERIEKLQEENDEYQKTLELEKAKEALLKAQQQRTKYLYAGAGKGFIYQTDTDAIAEAEETLSNLTFEATIDSLEKEKELLQDILDQLDETEEQWAKISSNFDNQKAKSTAQELFGDDYANIILNSDPAMIADIMNNYTSAQQKLEDNEGTIKSLEEQMAEYDIMIDKWNSVATAKEEAVNREHAAALLGQQWEQIILANREIDFENFKNNYIGIQDQIESNESLIVSNEEKIVYYEQLKAEWETLDSKYQEMLENKIAADIFGANWETELLAGRLQALDGFSAEYLAIQAKIDDNQSLIDSYNEKIEYYQKLKDEWSSITTTYQDEIDAQLLNQELGLKDESELFDERAGIVDNFRIKYEEAQRKVAEAAEKSADRQYQAALKAKQANDMLGNPGGIVENTNTTTKQGLWKIVDSNGKYVQGGFSTKAGAEHVLKSVFYGAKGYKIEEYHTGLEQGYVGNSKYRPMTDDERLNILRRASIDGLKNNEVPAILQKGELVLTKDQIKGITNSLVVPDYYSGLIKGLTGLHPDVQRQESVVQQNITITLPNITNNGGYDNLVRALNQLSNDALQFSKRN